MKLIGNKIAVRSLEKKENTTESGIILGTKPKNNKEYEVVLVSEKAKEFVNVGQKVKLFQNGSNLIPVEYQKETLFITNIDNVDLVLEQ